jgi:hypothetical protein
MERELWSQIEEWALKSDDWLYYLYVTVIAGNIDNIIDLNNYLINIFFMKLTRVYCKLLAKFYIAKYNPIINDFRKVSSEKEKF